MRVVITGGAGFLGSRLAREILDRGALTDTLGKLRTVRELVLVDVVAPGGSTDPRVSSIVGSLDDRALVEAAVTPATDSVFHLAAVVSGQAEADFDIGMRVNVDATRNLLERCRTCVSAPKVVFASSLAVFGGALPDPVPDDAPLMPQSSYGTQKAIGELLISDMSRKQFIDGRSLRLPTIVVRPGQPNKAASSFASAIIREPLAGIDAKCPVGASTRMWLQSPRAVIHNLIVGHEVPAQRLAGEPSCFALEDSRARPPVGRMPSRSINVPGICVAVGDMVSALRVVAGDEVADRLRWEYDPVVDRIVSTWPARFTADAGRALGMRADDDFESIVRAYIADTAAARNAAL